jgi:hypothetical protein
MASVATLIESPPTAASVAKRVEVPTDCVDQGVADQVSETGTNSHNAAFETWLSEKLLNRGSSGSSEADLPETVREAVTNPRLADSRFTTSRSARRKSPADGRQSPGRAGHGCHIDK